MLEAAEDQVEDARATLRKVEVPFVKSRLSQIRGQRQEALTVRQLHIDGLLAREHGLRFTVTGLDRDDRRPINIEEAGSFDDPTEAINHARSLDHEEAHVAVSDYPYWSSLRPDVLFSSSVERATFEAEAGEHQTLYATQYRHVVEQQQRITAILAVNPAMIETIRESPSDIEAIAALTNDPHGLTAHQARHVLMNLGLRNLTRAGRSELEHELATLQLPDGVLSDESQTRTVLSPDIIEGL